MAEAVGMESRPLGRMMVSMGVQAVKCHCGRVQAGGRYTYELKEKIEGMLRARSLQMGKHGALSNCN